MLLQQKYYDKPLKWFILKSLSCSKNKYSLTFITYRINVSIDIFMDSNSSWLSIGRRRTFSYPAYMNGRVGHLITGRSWLFEEVNDFFIIKLQKLRRYLCRKMSTLYFISNVIIIIYHESGNYHEFWSYLEFRRWYTDFLCLFLPSCNTLKNNFLMIWECYLMVCKISSWLRISLFSWYYLKQLVYSSRYYAYLFTPRILEVRGGCTRQLKARAHCVGLPTSSLTIG